MKILTFILLLESCAMPSVELDGLVADAESHLAYDVIRFVEEGDALVARRVTSGNAAALGRNEYAAPRHVFPRGTTQLLLADSRVVGVREVRAGADSYRPHALADVSADWVVFQVSGAPSPALAPVRARVAVGDVAQVLPDTTAVRVVAVDLPGGLLAIEAGAAAPGWSGRPVVVGGVVVGLAQGCTPDGEYLVVVPLPLR